MPYTSELEEKKTKYKETERDKTDAVFQWFEEAFDEDDAGAPQSDEGGRASVGLKAGSDNDSLFSFIREAHLHEALEFRQKGYNSQVPSVDRRLVTMLRKNIVDTRTRISLRTGGEGQPGFQWLLKQLQQIERFTDRLSDGMQEWVCHEVAGKSGKGAGETPPGSRSSALSLVLPLPPGLPSYKPENLRGRPGSRLSLVR